MTPLKPDCAPIGKNRGTKLARRPCFSESNAFWKLAFSRSILLMTIMRGSARSSQYDHASSVPTSTPATLSTRISAHSTTRTAPFTSPTKSV